MLLARYWEVSSFPPDLQSSEGVGQVGVGHDGGRVGVDQDHPVPLLAQRPDGLRPRIVELGRLPDDDGPAAEDQDALEVVAPGHCLPVLRSVLLHEIPRVGSRARAPAPSGWREKPARAALRNYRSERESMQRGAAGKGGRRRDFVRPRTWDRNPRSGGRGHPVCVRVGGRWPVAVGRAGAWSRTDC